MSRSAAALALGLLTAACGSDPLLAHDVERLVTISQGVYGQTYSVSDVCPGGVCAETPMVVEIPVSGASLPSEIVARSSGPLGFYELALPVGEFMLCSSGSLATCTTATVTAGARVRKDLIGGPAIFWK